MNKQDFINEVIFDMQKIIKDDVTIEFLKMSLTTKLVNYEFQEIKELPSTEVHDEDWIIKRFVIDLVARGLAERTIRQYANTARGFLHSMNLTYDQVTGQHITDYLALKQYKDHISPSYKATLRRYLSAFFKWAYRKGYIETDVLLTVEEVKFKQKTKERISDMEVEKMRQAVKNDARERALLEFMLSCGPRVGEIVRLNIEDINFKENKVRIYGEKTKTERIGFLTVPAKLALEEYLGDRKTGPLFLNLRNQRVSISVLEKIAKGIGVKGGCPLKTTVHVYRKTFASTLYRKTSDIVLVSKLLGHGDTTTTIKYYLVDDIDDMQHKMQKVY